jgi:hypothetical protein
MIYAVYDAERSSACEISYACRGKIAVDLRKDASRGHPDARRLGDLDLMMSQLRDDIVAVRAGDRAVTTRVRVMYGALVRTVNPLSPLQTLLTA